MTTAYTSLLGLALPVTGELSGTWGDTVNNAITSLLDTAVAGTTSITTDADITLTTTTGASNQARQAIILWNPASGTTTRNITAPAQSKMYTVINATGGTQSIVLRGAGPTTGVTIVAGEKAVCAWNGSDFVKVGSTVANAGGSNTQVQFNSSGVLAGSASLTWSGTVLTSSGFAGPLNGTVGATTPAAGAFTTVSASGVATFSAGTVSAPAITTTGDTNTGIFFPAADTIAFTEGGAESMRIDSSGNLLVGYTGAAPAKLYVVGTGWIDNGSNSANIFYVNAGGEPSLRLGQIGSVSYISAATSGGQSTSLAFQTAVGSGSITEKMRIDSSGNVGIGTSSPSQKLDVVGAVRLGTTGTDTYFSFGANKDIYLTYGNSAGGLFMRTDDGAVRATLNNSGNLGLGVTPSAWSSSYKALQFGTTGTLYSSNSAAIANNMYVNSGGTNTYITTAGSTVYLQNGSQHAWYNAPSGTAGNAITFTQAMTLDASGRLGIGTSSPTYKLEVYESSAAGLDGLKLSNTEGSFVIRVNDDNAFLQANTTVFRNTAETERMRIDSSGNVGIGTSSPSFKLDVTGTGRFTGITQFDNAINLKTATLNYVYFDDALAFSRNGVGERMRIDSSGNVGIGTSSPGGSSTNRQLTLQGTTAQITLTNGSANFNSGINASNNGYLEVSGANPLLFYTNSSERMRIDSSGNLLVGTTSVSGGRINVLAAAGATGIVVQVSTNGNYGLAFNNASGTNVGRIQIDSAATQFVTTSDYRLKNSIAPMTGALAKVALLKPCTYKWNEDNSDAEGFIAHELAEICPQAVSGAKDAVDADGNIISQGIDTSFLVATLTAAIQEQQALIQDLTTRLAALESKA